MSSGLELYDSRIDRIELVHGVATIHFSHAYIHQSAGTPGRDGGTGWSRAAELILLNATISRSPSLPGSITGGHLDTGGIKYDIIPLPFKRRANVRLYLQFSDASELDVTGERPTIELLGTPIYLENF